MTYVVPEELKELLGPSSAEDAPVLARILERHEEMVRDQVRREAAAGPAPAFGHEIRFFLHPGPEHLDTRAHCFGAECSCRTWNSGLNALKWVLLGIQDHLAAHKLTWDTGNLADSDELEEQLKNARWRLDAARDALIADGYFRPGEVNDDIAPRITEVCSHWRERLDEQLPGSLLEALDQLRAQATAALETWAARTR